MPSSVGVGSLLQLWSKETTHTHTHIHTPYPPAHTRCRHHSQGSRLSRVYCSSRVQLLWRRPTPGQQHRPKPARGSHQQLSAPAHAPLDGVKVRLYVHRSSRPISLNDSTIPQSLTTGLSSPRAGPSLSPPHFKVRVTLLPVAPRVLRQGKRLNRNPIASPRRRCKWMYLTQTYHSSASSIHAFAS
jgi:hypothetical protein